MSWSARGSMSSIRASKDAEPGSCFTGTNVAIVFSLVLTGAAGGLTAFFIQAAPQTRGFLPGTASPLVGVWWSIFLAIWALVFLLEISSRNCAVICESRSGPRWFLGLLATVSLLIHLFAGGCMIFLKVGFDYFGGSLAFAASFVSMGLIFSIVNRVRTVEAPAVAIVLEEGDDIDDGPVTLDDGDEAPDVREVQNVVAASMLPDEDVERALLLPPSPRSSFSAGLGGGGSPHAHGASGAVLLMSSRALRHQSRSTFSKAFSGPRFCRFSLIFLDIFLFFILIIEAFAAYQAVATAVDASVMAPPTGQLYPVANGAYKLHLYCMDRPVENNNATTPGNGTVTRNVTVIFENGLAAVSSYWSAIQPQLLNRSSLSVDRVCTYDRAGYGWSQRGQFPRTSNQIATELYDLLAAANMSGPFVMVAHSFGGMNARVFTAKYPHLVSGLVLIDASHEYQGPIFDQSLNKTYPSNPADLPESKAATIGRILAPVGIFRMSAAAMLPPQLPADARGTTLAWMSVNSFPDAIWSEGWNMNFESSAEVNRTRFSLPNGTFGDLPLTVLTAGQTINGTCKGMNFTEDSQQCKDFKQDIVHTGPVWFNLQKDLASLSTDSTWKIVWESGHNIALEFPEIVIDAVLDIAQKSRAFHPPAPPTTPTAA